jgi:hypothetical protein
MAHQDARFIPVRKKFDQLSIIKDYAVHPRLDYRYVISTSLTALGKNICTKVLEACLSSRQILSGLDEEQCDLHCESKYIDLCFSGQVTNAYCPSLTRSIVANRILFTARYHT